MKRLISCTLTISLLIAVQGPSVDMALANMAAAQSARAVSPVASVPLSLGSLHSGVGIAGSPITGTALPMSGSSLVSLALPQVARPLYHSPTPSQRASGTAPLPGTPPIRRMRVAIQGRQGAAMSEAGQAEKDAPAQSTQKKSKGARIKDFFLRLIGRKKTAPVQGPDYQGMLIDRVNEIEKALEEDENGGKPYAEYAKATADEAWDGNKIRFSKDFAIDKTIVRVEPRAKKGSVPLPENARLQKSDVDAASARSPPKEVPLAVPMADAPPARPSIRARILSKIPDVAVAPLAAAIVVGLDFAARAAFPALFGFAPLAALWVTAGMGVVLGPMMVATRLELSKKYKDPAVRPLKRYGDALIGMLLGAAIVTAIGLAQADVSILVFGGLKAYLALNAAPGVISLAPYLGMIGLMLGMSFIYGAGHTAYGLKHRRLVSPSVPLHFIFKLFLFMSVILRPGSLFMALSGTLAVPMLVGLLSVATFFAYFQGEKRLAIMTARNISMAELQREIAYKNNPGMRGLLDPAPEMGEEWRISQTKDLKASETLRKTKRRSALALLALIGGALGLLALHQLSITAALAFAGPMYLQSLKMLVPMFLLSGFVAVLFFRAKRVREGKLYDMVKELAAKAKLPMPRVYATGEKGSPNAFAAGALYHLAVVAVVGSIRKLLNFKELRGVLGHELSHVKYRHMLYFLAAIPLLSMLQSIGGGSLFQLVVSFWATAVWVLLFSAVSRANERMADAGSGAMLGDSKALATGLRKMSIMGRLVKKVPHSAGSWLYRAFLSHPAPQERVSKLGRTK